MKKSASKISEEMEKRNRASDAAFREHLASNYQIVEIQGDGNCLFYAIALVVKGSTERQMEVRREIQQFMRDHDGDFIHFYDENRKDEPTFAEDVERTTENKYWGAEPHIRAACLLYQRTIIVHSPPYLQQNHAEDLPFREFIRLSFHGGNHYNLLLPRPWIHLEQVQHDSLPDDIIANPAHGSTNMIKCQEPGCQESCQSLRDLQHHAQVAHNQRLIPCHACEGRLYIRDSLRCHDRTKHNGTNQCPFCSKILTDLHRVSIHLEEEHLLEKGLHELTSETTVPEEVDLQAVLDQYVEPIQGMLKMTDGPFITVYDEQGMHPVFVFEGLNAENLKVAENLQQETFLDDVDLPYLQVTPEAISYAGYDRGHLAPRRNYTYSQESLRSTFKMRNIVPMTEFINSGLINTVDEHIRKLIRNGWTLKVLTAPAYSKSVPGEPTIGGYEMPIPVWFFKVIWMDHGSQHLMQVFQFPNSAPDKNFPLFYYKSTLEKLQMLTPIRVKAEACRDLSWDIPRVGYRCGSRHCNMTFLNEKDRQDHELSHRRIFKCSRCSRKFGTEEEKFKCYHAHPKYVCTTCKREFTLSSTLAAHMRTHTGERPFACKVCGKTYRQQQGIVDHMRLHTGERPFKCPYCNWTFCRHGHLNRHIRRWHPLKSIPKQHNHRGKTMKSSTLKK